MKTYKNESKTYAEFEQFLAQFPSRVRECISGTLLYSSFRKWSNIVEILSPKRGMWFIRYDVGGWVCPKMTDAVTPGKRYSYDGWGLEDGWGNVIA